MIFEFLTRIENNNALNIALDYIREIISNISGNILACKAYEVVSSLFIWPRAHTFAVGIMYNDVTLHYARNTVDSGITEVTKCSVMRQH